MTDINNMDILLKIFYSCTKVNGVNSMFEKYKFNDMWIIKIAKQNWSIRKGIGYLDVAVTNQIKKKTLQNKMYCGNTWKKGKNKQHSLQLYVQLCFL